MADKRFSAAVNIKRLAVEGTLEHAGQEPDRQQRARMLASIRARLDPKPAA